MADIAFIAVHPSEQGRYARILLDIAAAIDVPAADIKLTTGGFNVPVIVAVSLASISEEEGDTSFSEPVVEPTLAEVVAVAKEVRAELAEPDREAVRTWAREQGIDVADKGRLKQSVIDQFLAANSAK